MGGRSKARKALKKLFLAILGVREYSLSRMEVESLICEMKTGYRYDARRDFEEFRLSVALHTDTGWFDNHTLILHGADALVSKLGLLSPAIEAKPGVIRFCFIPEDEDSEVHLHLIVGFMPGRATQKLRKSRESNTGTAVSGVEELKQFILGNSSPLFKTGEAGQSPLVMAVSEALKRHAAAGNVVLDSQTVVDQLIMDGYDVNDGDINIEEASEEQKKELVMWLVLRDAPGEVDRPGIPAWLGPLKRLGGLD